MSSRTTTVEDTALTQKSNHVKHRLHRHPTIRVRQHILRMRVNHTAHIAEPLIYLRVDVALDVSTWSVWVD